MEVGLYLYCPGGLHSLLSALCTHHFSGQTSGYAEVRGPGTGCHILSYCYIRGRHCSYTHSCSIEVSVCKCRCCFCKQNIWIMALIVLNLNIHKIEIMIKHYKTNWHLYFKPNTKMCRIIRCVGVLSKHQLDSQLTSITSNKFYFLKAPYSKGIKPIPCMILTIE